MNQITRILTLATLALATAYLQPSLAAAAHGCCNTCPRCNTCCQLDVEQVDEEKKCWKVECEQICVPRVVFPWQKSCCNPCANNGAFVKTVKVLKAHTYTCPTCEYSWTPVRKGCGACCGAAMPTDQAEPPTPTPLPAPTPAPVPEPPAAALDATDGDYFGVIAEPRIPVHVANLEPSTATGQPRLIRKVSDFFTKP